MHLHALDIGIIIGYFVLVITIGLWVSRQGAKDLDSYFLGGKSMKWYTLGVSDAAFAPNHNAARDLSNVAVGIVWQLCLVTLPIYLVLQQWTVAAGIAVLLAVTTGYIKINWYDRLEKATD